MQSVCNLYDEKNFAVCIRPLKQALNRVIKEVHKVVQFNKESMVKRIYWNEY